MEGMRLEEGDYVSGGDALADALDYVGDFLLGKHVVELVEGAVEKFFLVVYIAGVPVNRAGALRAAVDALDEMARGAVENLAALNVYGSEGGMGA